MTPTPIACTLFDTALGRCGIAWSAGGIAAVQLPEADAAATRARLLHRHRHGVDAAQPPAEVQRAIDGIRALLRGEPVDLLDVVLDLSGVLAFAQRVYAAARRIPPGQTLTYGELARRIGEPGAARAVGHALGANPYVPVVPCHRVLAAGRGWGGFSAHGGVVTKRRLLALEGVRVDRTPDLFDPERNPV